MMKANIKGLFKTVLSAALAVAVVGSSATYANAAGVNASKANTYTLFSSDSVSKAAQPAVETLFETPEWVTADANTEYSHDFTVEKSTNVYLYVYVPETAVNCTVSVSNSAGQGIGDGTVASTDWQFDENVNAYWYSFGIQSLAAGDYTVKLSFDAATQYLFAVDAEKVQPTLNATKATITAGFKKTLKVDNTTEKVKWSSNKKSVATVSSKGVVTAVKAGKATISAKVGDTTLKCTVTVKNNVFSETKQSASSIPYGAALQVYKASYASNGDLTLKCRFINNTSYHVTALKNIKIVFKSDANKTIGTYSAKSKTLSVSPGSTKDFSVTIAKSKLKIKKADLRNANYSTDGGEYEYRY